MTVIIVTAMLALIIAAVYAGAQTAQSPADAGAQKAREQGAEPAAVKVSTADAGAREAREQGPEVLTDQALDLRKLKLDEDLLARLTGMATETAQMQALQDQRLAAALAFEKKLTAEKKAFYDTLKTKPIRERPAAFAAFVQQRIELHKSFAKDQAKFEALRQSFQNAQKERQKRDVNLPR